MGWQEDYAREKAEKAHFKEVFVPAVAAELNALGSFPGLVGADTDVEPWGGRIIDGDGRGYYLGYPFKGKTEITPIYPRSSFGWYKTDRGKIGVSVSRGPQAVAREIARRLAPVYEAALAKVLAYEADLAVDQGQRGVLTEKLAALFPDNCVSAPSHSQSEYSTQLVIHGPGSGGGWVQYSGGGGDVMIGANHGFRVPAGVATQMLAIYGDYVREETAARIARLGLEEITAPAGQFCDGVGGREHIGGKQAVRDGAGRVYCLAHLPGRYGEE